MCLGTQSQLATFAAAIKAKKLLLEPVGEAQLLQDYFATLQENAADAFIPCVIHINEASGLIGQSLQQSDVRHDWHCLAVALERGGYMLTNLDVNLLLQKGDMLWLLGKQEMVAALIKRGLL